MTPEEHAAMIATRARFIANGEAWRIPKVGVQTSTDGTGDVPSFAAVPKSMPAPAPVAAPAQPERLTLCDECAAPIEPLDRVILQHRSAIDHDTHYLTVVHRFPCLAVVAERFG